VPACLKNEASKPTPSLALSVVVQMPLFDMSLNIEESEAAGRKRSHDQFTGVVKESEDASSQGMENKAVKQENNNGSLQGKMQLYCTLPTS
jgi:hypothetical protein